MNKIVKNLAATGLAITMLLGPASADQANYVHLNTDTNRDKIIENISNLSNEGIQGNSYLTSKDMLIDSLPAGVLIAEDMGEHSFELEESASKDQDLIVIGGPNAISEESLQGSEVSERIYGETRFDTAYELAHKLGVDRDIIITSGSSLADSIAAISLASHLDANILMVGSDIPKATRDYLENYGRDKKIMVVGGEATVSDALIDEIEDLAGPASIERLAGKNRYETSEIIADEFTGYDSVVYTEGDHYDKGYAAAIFAAKNNAPLLLIDKDLGINLSDQDKTIENTYLLTEPTIEINGLEEENLNIIDLNGQAVNLDDYQAKRQDLLEEIRAKEEEEARKQKEEEEKAQLALEDVEYRPNGDMINHTKSYIKFTDGTKRKFKAVHTMNTTAYNIFPGSTGYTASGTRARYGAVSVDPNFIALGTELYITSNDDWPDYGYARAEDTGSAIKGNKLDLFFDEYETCCAFGRRNTTLYILGEEIQ